MSFFKPDYFIDSIYDLPPNLFLYNNIKLIILDIDDTLTKRNEQYIDPKTLNWIKIIKETDIKLFLVSNNFPKRVKDFAKKIGLPFICLSGKPLPFGFLWALIKTHIKRQNTFVIGDQIFADILGAKLIGAKSALVEPKSASEKPFMKFKRMLESRIKSKLHKNIF